LPRRKALFDTTRDTEEEARRLYASGDWGAAYEKQFDAGAALDSEQLVVTRVDKACKKEWLSCADGVNRELDKNPTDPKRLLHR
jgi:hypothetical protein